MKMPHPVFVKWGVEVSLKILLPWFSFGCSALEAVLARPGQLVAKVPEDTICFFREDDDKKLASWCISISNEGGCKFLLICLGMPMQVSSMCLKDFFSPL